MLLNKNTKFNFFEKVNRKIKTIPLNYLIALIIPIFVLMGSILTYYAPRITQVSNEYVSLVRITASILVLNIIVKSVFSLFESVLRGMNIGYKSMGVRAFIIMFGGGLKVVSL